jgi:kynurenine formamidase
VDAPRHFIPDGPGADQLALEIFVGPCAVADATAASRPIDAELIESLDLSLGTERILLKTRDSRLWERDSFTTLVGRWRRSHRPALVDCLLSLRRSRPAA